MLIDGRTDVRTENRTPISHPATSRCDNEQKGLCPGVILSYTLLNWIKNEMIFYCISELMLATLIQRYNKKSFHFKNKRLTEILRTVKCHIY